MNGELKAVAVFSRGGNGEVVADALLSCLPFCVRSAVAVTGVSKGAAV